MSLKGTFLNELVNDVVLCAAVIRRGGQRSTGYASC